jgi:hypothetical protein
VKGTDIPAQLFSLMARSCGRYVRKLLAIRACGENCVLATQVPSSVCPCCMLRCMVWCRWLQTEEASGQNILILCNAIGSPVDSKYRQPRRRSIPRQNRLALLSACYSAPVSTYGAPFLPPSPRQCVPSVALMVGLQHVKLFSLRRRISMSAEFWYSRVLSGTQGSEIYSARDVRASCRFVQVYIDGADVRRHDEAARARRIG